MRSFIVLATLMGAVMLSPFAVGHAQTRATVLLKSGDRVTGEFQDIENDQIYLRLSQDEERRIPVDDALVIDLEGAARDLPRDEAQLASGPGDVVVLRNGTTWKGTLQDVHRVGEGGAQTIAGAAIEVVFRHKDGTERLPLDRVARLYLSEMDLHRYKGAVAQAATAPQETAAPTPTVSIPVGQAGNVTATSPWTQTQLVVSEGELVTFKASGEIAVGPNEVATVDGSRAERRDPSAPLPQVLAGALIGRVGTGPPFGIGSQVVPLRMPAAGQLYLGINEGTAGLADNSGAFIVTVSK